MCRGSLVCHVSLRAGSGSQCELADVTHSTDPYTKKLCGAVTHT